MKKQIASDPDPESITHTQSQVGEGFVSKPIQDDAVFDWIFAGGSALLSISISFNALSGHAACTAIFVAVAAIIAFIFSSIQTLARISWLAWLGAACIITAGKFPRGSVRMFV
ncbi:hypothetical protein APSETT444_007065 [Aspergillus pseudonomiae]